jgi:nucleotide-binding universal stress UspA family protein
MLKHVLVPLDGSQLAEEALNHAIDILAPEGKITLVAAVEMPEVPVYGYYPITTVPDYQATVQELIPQVKSYLENIAGRIREHKLSVSIETHIGDPAEVITDIARKQHVDAIVMSTHGRSGLNRWLFGSVTNKVLGAKPCPVFVVPSHEKVREKV